MQKRVTKTRRAARLLCIFLLLTPFSALAWQSWLPSQVIAVAGVNATGRAAAPTTVAEKLVQGGREEVVRRPIYRSTYHKGGYPPADEGVCTDLIWRACKVAGYDLKALIDADIRKNPALYPRVANTPDPHIDFRRVANQAVYFKSHAQSLSIKIAPQNMQVMQDWLPGDIVVFRNPHHIAILSDRRNADHIPYLIHNQGPWATEGDDFMSWYERGIVARFRLR